MDSPTIRRAVTEDYDAVADVIFDAVRNGPSPYSEEQRNAWMPQRRADPEWHRRLDAQTIFVGEDQTQLVGLMSLAKNGYIDFAFIRPSARGAGLFRRLYHEVENLACDTRENRLWTHASLMAEPAFAAMGFTVVKEETVQIGSESLERFEMEKQLQ